MGEGLYSIRNIIDIIDTEYHTRVYGLFVPKFKSNESKTVNSRHVRTRSMKRQEIKVKEGNVLPLSWMLTSMIFLIYSVMYYGTYTNTIRELS